MGSEAREEGMKKKKPLSFSSVSVLPRDLPASAEEASSEWNTSVWLVPNRHIVNNGHLLPSDGTSWMTYSVSAFFVCVHLLNSESGISPSPHCCKPLAPFCSHLALLLSEATITGMTP